MAGIVVVAYGLGSVVAAVVLWFVRRKRVGASIPSRLAPVIRAAQRRSLIAVLFAATVFIAGMLVAVAMPELLGQPFAVSPLVAGAAGMLLYSATPPRQTLLRDDEPRVAQLVPRSAFAAVRGRWAAVFLMVTGLFIVLVLICGVMAGVDEEGRSRTIRFEAQDVSSSSSPFPGWFYGVPALLALALLVMGVLVALQRISATPAFPRAADESLDRLWRRMSVEVILKLGVGAALFTGGGMAVIAGITMGNATIESSTDPGFSVLAGGLLISGTAALVLSIVSVTLAALTAVAIGEAATRVAAVR